MFRWPGSNQRGIWLQALKHFKMNTFIHNYVYKRQLICCYYNTYFHNYYYFPIITFHLHVYIILMTFSEFSEFGYSSDLSHSTNTSVSPFIVLKNLIPCSLNTTFFCLIRNSGLKCMRWICRIISNLPGSGWSQTISTVWLTAK